MAKKRTGQQSVNKIKTSNFLPSVFQTDLNKNWLDSTMDQMVSKGPLDNIDGYVGSKDGKVATANDEYLEPKYHKSMRSDNQLQPGIVSFDKMHELTNIITFDDVAHSINENFSTYNYNAAYASGKYSFNPPIDVDKFVNYVNYRWVEELPVYESVLTTGTNVNAITNIQTNGHSTLTDNNNTFTLENNMLIKFTGASWHADVLNKTFLVTGSVGKHILYEYIDENNKRVYNNTVIHTETVDGVWAENKLVNAEPNTNSTYWVAGRTPTEVIQAYNIDPSRPPVFDGFKFPEFTSNQTMLSENILVNFTGAWGGSQDATIKYSIEIEGTNTATTTITIKLPTVATALQVAGIQTVTPTSVNLMYDSGMAVEPLKDYIVIAKDDPFQTAWSRANHWVNISTINKLVELMPTYDFTEVKNVKRKAIRPIIEYNSGLNLWNQAEYGTHNYFNTTIDYAVVSADSLTGLTAGDTYVYVDSTTPEIRIATNSSGGFTVAYTLTDHDTFAVDKVLSGAENKWVGADGYYLSNTIVYAQQKRTINEYPRYKFYNTKGIALENIDGKGFTGQKIFGYKVGTGTNDTELGMPLSYKDTPKGAEYEFENFILTEKYYTTYANAENSRGTYSKEQTGYNLYKQRNVLKSMYTPAGDTAGATEHAQYKVAIIDTPLTIPYGYNNWRLQESYLIIKIGETLSIATSNITGVANTTRTGNAELFNIGVDHEIKFNDLTGQTITFVSHGVNIETTPISEVTIARSGGTITVTTSASSDNTHFDVVANGTVLQSFVVTKQYENLLHNITVNGKAIAPANVTVNATTIVIDESILAVDDLVDLYWRSNDLTNKTTNISLPEIHSHNANNTVMETFTISETINHWADKLNVLPGFNGKTFGNNNYASVPHTAYYGGTIFMHEDISIMHDINYANEKLTMTGALVEQAKEFVAFRDRVGAQARRIWTTGASSLQDFTNSAIAQVMKTKSTYTNSNMISIQTDDRHEFKTTNSTTTIFKTRFTFNGDVNIRDHVYVYVTESSLRKLLIKDKEYTLIGDTITLTTAPGTNAVVEVYHTSMDDWDFVPASMVKLGLSYGTEPQVNNNILYTHDGVEIDVTGKNLEDINASNFDPVNAVIFEMEKRIHAGLVKHDTMYDLVNQYEEEGLEKYSSYVEYIPTQHVSTWFALKDLDNYVEKHYHAWARLKKITSLNTANYYDAADSFTWNYSTISIGDGFTGNKLPGHWKGAYTHLFGTCTPHINPWHMLGYAFKPTWWDTHYSWKNTANGGSDAKRTALLGALKLGVVSNPSGPTTQIIRNARFIDDYFDTGPESGKCPVLVDGTLALPKNVLGTPANVDKAAEFVFGDWGPVEAKWRLSADGQAIMTDAILKLVPGKAWSDFFQPGVISKHASIIRNINYYTEHLPSSNSYKTPGKQYGKIISEIKVVSSPTTLEEHGYFKILDDYESTIGKARYKKNSADKITSISLTERAMDITGQHIIAYVGTKGKAEGIDLEVKFKETPFVANGLAQAQYNYLIRHNYTDDLHDLYSLLTTKLQAKLNGFTSKHLLGISAETSLTGDVELGGDDFSVKMYKGAVSSLLTASSLIITKTLTGYTVEGISNNNREFKFYEPDITNATDYTTQNIASQTVRRYNKFVTTPSIVEYDAEFEKLQDVYNFIRGYWKWMEAHGYTLEYDGDSSARDFVAWALTAEVTNAHILQIGRYIKFKPDHGHVYEYNQLEYGNNDVLFTNATKIENTQLGVKRVDGVVSIETKQREFIGSISSAVLDYEHIVVFENKTKLGVNIFDDVTSNRQQRLRIKGQRTQDWTGEQKAPGYLIAGDSIVQNFDSAVQSIDDMYRTDVDEFNKSLGKAKDLTIGNIEGVLLDNLGINKNVLTNYHQGMIKEKGTVGAIEHIGKNTLLHNNETKVSAYEQYMFRQSTLGNDDMEDPLEIEIVSSDINSSPQTISLNTGAVEANVIKAYTDADADGISEKIVNDKAMTFETKNYTDADTDILTGGEPLETETKYRVLRSAELSSVFDSTEDYANFRTWNNSTSYKKGDMVRYRGQLYECNTNFTGLTEVSPLIEVTTPIAANGPILVYGTVANIAGTTVTLNKQETPINDVVVTGTQTSPAFLESETLVINGATITFSKQAAVPTVVGPAVILANGNPDSSWNDVTGKSITINIRHATNGNSNTVIDFDTTPADVVENFTGDGTLTTFTVAQALSGATYSVGSITVDGVAQATPTDYAMTSQNIVFTSAPANSSAIVVTLVHVPDQMANSDILNKINSYSIPNLTTTFVTSNGIELLQFSYQDTDVENDLVLEASGTNASLGFAAGQTVVAQQKQNNQTPVNLNVTEMKDQINATSHQLLTNIAATVVSNALVITQTNLTNMNALVISGSARALLGLAASTTPTTGTPFGVSSNYTEAVAAIQAELTAQSITEVNVVLIGNKIKITSSGTSLTLGDTNFNAQTGLQTGTITAADGNIANDWSVHAAYFTAIDDSLDPALYNILVSDDSDFQISSIGSVVTKFWGWNVLQVTQRGDYNAGTNVHTSTPLYTLPDPVKNAALENPTTCGICAGKLSKDGNDAEITTNAAHGLQVGDWVQLLNTDCTPTIDGIHKVTKVGDPKMFYIDEYIEQCGNAVSVMPLVTTRFATQIERDGDASVTGAEEQAAWNIPTGSKTFLSKSYNIPGTYVYTKTATNTYDFVRSTTTRPTNKDVDSVVIYNHTDNLAKIQLEVWDPMRKILPGVAQQNLDYTNFSDNAIYSTSTDDAQLTDTDVSWGNDEVGTRWWDISKVRYYDYDQGDSVYKSNHWGKLYPGGEVVIWEWVKSTVAPDDYSAAVKSNKEMFGVVATGEAYSVYDEVLKETLYYYTTEQEWNVKTNSYSDVYYYWVKNKTTIADTRSLSAFDVANMITDPTAAGVSWFAVISDKEFIVDNINYYIDDAGTVLQINKAGDKYKSHNEWTLIAKGPDSIPEYYINGMMRNFAGRDVNKNNIPFQSLHKFNRIGDDLDIGQTWFANLNDARRDAIVTINALFKHINLADELNDTWDTTFVAKKFPTFLWKWEDYKLKSYHGTYNHTRTINTYSDLNSIDRTIHQVVKLDVFDTGVQLNRSEIYAYNNTNAEWELVLKRNNTIKFDEGLLTATGGWDRETFDSWPYDQADIAEYWEILIEALWKDIFVYYNEGHMNTFFFSIIHYILSYHYQTNWIRKTTYIKLEFTDSINNTTRKYTRDKLNNVLGYINEVKPYHTKSSTITTKHTNLEQIGLTLTETPQTVITIKPSDYDAAFGGTTYAGESSWGDTATTTVTGGEFTTNHTSTDIVSGVDFTEAQLFNYTVGGHNRNSFVNLYPSELLNINVQTNATGSTHASTSRTFTHIINVHDFIRSYALTEAKETTLTSALDIDDTSISVASTSAFDDTGIAYIHGELIEYAVTNATTLECIKRNILGTFAVSAAISESITQVNTTQLTFANDHPSEVQYNTLGDTILNSPASVQAQELQSFGKGVEL